MAEEEVAVNPVESAISVMLLGSIGFQMFLFYLLHAKDDDIKRYSWQVISQTISIFCAVLLFQGFNGLIEEYVIEGGGEGWEVMVDMTQFVMWLSAMQVVLAITSGAVSEMFGREAPKMQDVELNVKSFTVLFSHVAGFSSINAWGSLQQRVFCDSPALAFCVVPMGYVGLRIMYQGYAMIREQISRSDDEKVDEYEEKWMEEAEEAENDVAGLSLSFLTVQALRFYIGSHLPDQEGDEPLQLEVSHGGQQWLILGLCGLLSFTVGILVLRWLSTESFERIITILNNYFTFGTCWCCFYATKWFVSSWQMTQEKALLLVIIALYLSTISFVFIFVLDKVADLKLFGQNSEMADKAIDLAIQSLGILIGFSWEQCFHQAVEVIAVSTEAYCPRSISKLLLSFILVLTVFPAWRMYILKTECELVEEMENIDKRVLKTNAQQHYLLMTGNDVDESVLDLAHLRMKAHRRLAHGLEHPGHKAHPGLKHYQVTSNGIVEVEAVDGSNNRLSEKKGSAHQEIRATLLG